VTPASACRPHLTWQPWLHNLLGGHSLPFPGRLLPDPGVGLYRDGGTVEAEPRVGTVLDMGGQQGMPFVHRREREPHLVLARGRVELCRQQEVHRITPRIAVVHPLGRAKLTHEHSRGTDAVATHRGADMTTLLLAPCVTLGLSTKL
jgi:hypothetical protein